MEGTLTQVLDDLKRKNIKWRLITVGNNCHHWMRGQRKEVGMPEARSLEEGGLVLNLLREEPQTACS